MEKDIIEGKVGEVAAYDVEFKGGKLVAKIDASHSGVSAGVFIQLEANVVLDAMAKAIPGQIDDAVFGLIKSALAV